MRARSGSPAGSPEATRGVTLIEIMLALTILSVVLMGLGGLMFQAARHTRQSAAVAYRSSAITTAEAWSRALPWDSAPGAVGCTDSLRIGQLLYRRCVDLVVNTPRYQQLRVVIAPMGTLIAVPDTVVVDRSRSRSLQLFDAN